MKEEVLFLYNYDIYVGKLIKWGDTLSFVVENDKDPYAIRAIQNNDLTCNDSKRLWFFLIDERVMPEDRIDLQEDLAMLGLSVYDQWEIFVRVGGVNINDFIWVSKTPVDPATFWTTHPLICRFKPSEKRKFKARQKYDGADLLIKYRN